MVNGAVESPLLLDDIQQFGRLVVPGMDGPSGWAVLAS